MRHVRKLWRPPWDVFRIADTRRSLPERAVFEARFKGRRECRTPFGFCRMLLVLELALTTMRISVMLFSVAWFISLSLHNIERLHALNRRSADPRKSWHRFGADLIGALLSASDDHRRARIRIPIVYVCFWEWRRGLGSKG